MFLFNYRFSLIFLRLELGFKQREALNLFFQILLD